MSKICKICFKVVFCILVLFVFNGVFNKVYANVVSRILFNQSLTTPEVKFDNDFVPKAFNANNNLARNVGSYYFAKGDPLILEGIVTDINDIPIEGVKVNIWHANYLGYYQSSIQNEESDNFDINFRETGTSITDTLGRYMFLTIMPGNVKLDKSEYCPHINFLITYNQVKKLQTKIFFKQIKSDDCDNSKDFKILKLNSSQKQAIEQDLYYIDSRDQGLGKRVIFNIKINQIQPTKEF